MKKIFAFAFIALALSVVSCKKETPEPPTPLSVSATELVFQIGDSKTFTVTAEGAYDFTCTPDDIIDLNQNEDGSWTATAKGEKTGVVTVAVNTEGGETAQMSIEVISELFVRMKPISTLSEDALLAGCKDIEFFSNRSVQWSYTVKSEGMTEVIPTTFTQQGESAIVSLGRYTDSAGKDKDCVITLKVADEHGFEAELDVTSRAWTLTLFWIDTAAIGDDQYCEMSDPSTSYYELELAIAIKDQDGNLFDIITWLPQTKLSDNIKWIYEGTKYVDGWYAFKVEDIAYGNPYAHLYVNDGITDRNISATVGTYTQTIDFKGNGPY